MLWPSEPRAEDPDLSDLTYVTTFDQATNQYRSCRISLITLTH